MWMKAEPTKCPHRGSAGLTAPQAVSVQLSAHCQGKCYPSLAEARARQRKQGRPSPSRVRAEPLYSTPKPCYQNQGTGRPRLDAGIKDTVPRIRSKRVCVHSQASPLHLPRGSLEAAQPGVLKGITSIKQTRA